MGNYSRKVMVKNGKMMVPIYYYTCARCQKEICESDTHYKDDHELRWCWDCAFLEGKITTEEFRRFSPYGIFNCAIHDGKIEYWMGNNTTPPWERTSKQQRNTATYQQWRKDVFERDNYTCQDCGQRGRELNAHHIKPFATHPKLRHKLSNGVTLCVPCHKTRHKEGRLG